MRKTSIHVSHYTGEDGRVYWSVQWNGQAATASRPDEEQLTREYARALYHKQRGPKELCEWNGDTGTLTVEDAVTN